MDPDRAATVVFDVVPASHPDALGAMTRYFEEIDERFDGGFDPGDTLTVDAPSMNAPTGAFVVMRGDNQVIGCGGVKRHADAEAEIKRMWVAPDWRGLGLGVRLLAELEAHAIRLGNRSVVLDTNSVLLEAIAMYGRSGYQAIDRYNDNPYARHWFRKQLAVPLTKWSPRGESNS